MLNVIRNQDDPFYRYKMEKPKILHQKKHGGTTCFNNISTISKQIGTEPKCIKSPFHF